jgi:3-oxoacyl-(acyl-carrier-protein) synthase
MFDKNRAGLTVEERAEYVILSSNTFVKNNNLSIYGFLSDAGMTNDANHMTGPSRDGIGLPKAINIAVCDAEISKEDIGFICSHGTGTVYNDLMEVKVLKNQNLHFLLKVLSGIQ